MRKPHEPIGAPMLPCITEPRLSWPRFGMADHDEMTGTSAWDSWARRERRRADFRRQLSDLGALINGVGEPFRRLMADPPYIDAIRCARCNARGIGISATACPECCASSVGWALRERIHRTRMSAAVYPSSLSPLITDEEVVRAVTGRRNRTSR